MAFGQLYYTSCERGLSPYPGFQFNAATEGIPAEVMREVEALTSYEPPRSLGYRPTAEQIAACPVNLVHRAGAAPLLANVTFVGADFSKRMGNYFAHTLVAEGQPDLGPVLPIELWRSPFWVSTPVDDPSLPAVAALPRPGPLDRATVDARLGGADPGLLACLLTAAEQAITEGRRSVILVAPGAEDAACWIAAISYLLPPDTARRMSFMTYHRRPDHVRSHVVGTLPDSDLDLNEAAFRDNLLFDLGSGRWSEIEATPAARLLARCRIRDTAEFWRHARPLAGNRTPRTLADWGPALAAATVLVGRPVDDDELDQLVVWLSEQAGSVPDRERQQLVELVLQHPGCDASQLGPLARVAHESGLESALVTIERRAVEAELRTIGPGGDGPVSTGVPLRTAAGQEFAAQRCTDLLAAASPGTAVALLAWAADIANIRLPAHVLRTCGRDLLGPDLLAHPGSDLLDVLVGDEALMAGALETVEAAAAGSPGRVSPELAARVAGSARRVGLSVPPALARQSLVAEARAAGPDRFRVLARHAAEQEIGRGVLEALWPRGRWTARDALAFLAAFGDAEAAGPPWSVWLSGTFLEPEVTAVADFVELRDRLSRRAPLLEALTPEAAAEYDAFAATIKRVAEAKSDPGRAGSHVRELAGIHAGGGPLQRAFLVEALPPVIDLLSWIADPAEAVAALSPDLVAGYLRDCERRLAGQDDTAIGAAAQIFVLTLRLEGAKQNRLAPELRTLLRTRLRGWPGRRLGRVEKAIGRADPEAVRRFEAFRAESLTGRVEQFVRGFRTRGGDRS